MRAAGRADGGNGHTVRCSLEAIEGEVCICGLTMYV